MKSLWKVISARVPTRRGFPCPPEVGVAAKESGIQEGFCLVHSTHNTSTVFINNEEPGPRRDYLRIKVIGA